MRLAHAIKSNTSAESPSSNSHWPSSREISSPARTCSPSAAIRSRVLASTICSTMVDRVKDVRSAIHQNRNAQNFAFQACHDLRAAVNELRIERILALAWIGVARWSALSFCLLASSQAETNKLAYAVGDLAREDI